jgi:phage baseplate assembly protein W
MSTLSLQGLPSFYGKGLAFPFRLDPTNARPVISQDEQLILDSMNQIINTDIDERPFLTKNGVPFGTRCRRILFDDSQIAISIIQYEVKRALDVWEPRIVVDSVQGDEVVQSDGGALIVALTSFRFRATNRSDNFVTPFRLVRAQ